MKEKIADTYQLKINSPQTKVTYVIIKTNDFILLPEKIPSPPLCLNSRGFL